MARQADVIAVERALQTVPPGSAVMPVERPHDAWRNIPAHARGRYIIGGQALYWTLPSLALMQRQSFTLMFSAPGKQPIRALPPWNEVVGEASPWLAEHLRDGRGPQAKVLANWRQRFDHVLEINADIAGLIRLDQMMPGLVLVADEGFARLYRVVR